MLVLGIETSCDETAAAVVRDGREIVSSVISSQVPIHKRFGGVVPELASREHLDKIVPVVNEAFERAGVTARDIEGIAVTIGPGLVGSLLVGVSYAKAMAYALKKPFAGVNHIEGHIYSVAFENPPIEYPAEALIVSGGHTNIFFIPEPGKYKVVSRTRDDAAGEAFDKVAKLLGLGYPGGPIIERLAREGNPNAVPFSIPRMGDGLPDFSFSGLKTAVTKHVRESGLAPLENGGEPSQEIKDLAASFQHVVVQSLVRTMERIAEEYYPRTLIVAGGVACNGKLREVAREMAAKLNLPVYFPSPHLSTDNAAMIAAAGTVKLLAGGVACNGKLREVAREMAAKLNLPVYFPSPHLSTDNAAMIAAAGTVKLLAGERGALDMNADVTLRLQNLDLEEEAAKRAGARYRL